MYKLVRNESANFQDAVALVSSNAAAAANLSDRGQLVAGQRADFILVEAGELPKLMLVVAAGQVAYMAPGMAARLAVTA